MILDFRVQIPRERRATHRPGYMLRYRDVFDLDAVSYDEEQLLAQLEAAGIDRAVIQAEWSAGDYRAQNDVAAGLAQRYPERFCAFASVNPGDGPSAVYELIRAVEELEMRGLNVQPFAAELRANDRRLYPLYWKCLEYGVPVTIHTGINYSATRTMDYGRPLYVDQVACDFPGLVIVLNHGGWPWVHESVAMARKHPQIFVETGGIAPKYLAKPNSGWEVFLSFADNLLQDQILFATDSMIPFARAVKEARALELKPATKEKWLYLNAARLLDGMPRAR